MTSERTCFYRDKLNGKFLGVCAGIADYTGVDVAAVRIGLVLMTLAGFGFIVIPGYFVAAMMAPVKPAQLYADRDEQRFWQKVRQSPSRTARDVRARFRDIDRRLAEIEHHYVSSNPRLAAEIERLR